MFPWLKNSWFKLREALTGERPPQAILLYGGDGLGKKEIAEELGRLFLCESTSMSGYCGQCHACRLTLSGNHPDFYSVSSLPRTRIGIDAIRDIIASVAVTPKLGMGKAIIIENAEMMTVEAANAVLKVLEEPQGRTLFILTADRIQSLLPTVVSRCVAFRVPNPRFDEVKDWIYSNLATKGAAVSEELYRLNNCSPVDTVRFINSGYNRLYDSFTMTFAQIMHEPYLTSRLMDILTEISVKTQTEEAERSAAAEQEKEKETDKEKGRSKDKSKGARKSACRLCIADIYNWLYHMLSDIMRYKTTGSCQRNLILNNVRMLSSFDHISVECLDRSLARLKEMAQRERSMPNLYASLELTAFFNDLIRGI